VKILSYRELEPQGDFMLLMDQAFWWPASPTQFKKLIDQDFRLKDSPVGFCAVEDGKLAGFVGVMDIPTKTVYGKEEKVGGIWCVATFPGFAKKGICKTLMERSHQYFLEKNYSFSFLCTSRTIIAYAIYDRMDYVEVEKVNRYPQAYKVFSKDKVEMKPEKELDVEKIFATYQRFISAKDGFVIRPKDFFSFLGERKRYDDKKSIQEENGYALALGQADVIRIKELISLDKPTYHKLLDQIESIAQSGVIDRMVNDEKLSEVYKERGYSIEQADHGVLMVKNLGKEKFEEKYSNNFYFGSLDSF
jgi:predicted acetyltransferase